MVNTYSFAFMCEPMDRFRTDVYPFENINAAWVKISSHFPHMRSILPRQNRTNYNKGVTVSLSEGDMKLFNEYYATDIQLYKQVCMQHKVL